MSSISKNYMYNSIFNIFNIALPLITAPYLSRILGSEGIGRYTYYFSIAQYFALFAKMGLTNYGTRQLSFIKNDRDELKKAFTNLYLLQCGVTLITFLIYSIFCFVSVEDFSIAIVWGFWILTIIFDTDWFLFALEDFKTTALRNCVVKCIAAILIFVYVKDMKDVWKYTFITALSYSSGYMALWMKCKSYLSFRLINWKEMVCHIKPCFILMIPVVALGVYRTMDKVMLGCLSNMKEIGLYENAEKLIYCLTSFIASFGTVMMPRMSYLVAQKDKTKSDQYLEYSMTFIIFLASGMCFGISSISGSLIPLLYGNGFIDSVRLLRLLSITLIAIAWGNVIRTQYVMPNKKDSIYIGSILTGAVLNLCVNFFLIPRYHAVGACMGTIVAEFSVVFFQFLCLKNFLPYKRYLCNTFPFIVFGIIMYAICIKLENVMGVGLLTMFSQIFVGGFFYLGCSYFFYRLK